MQLTQLLSLSEQYLSRIHNLKKDDILTLREVIREHNRLYYEAESPIISDTEYDQLFHALARLESDHDMFDEDSPTARLAILASAQFKKVKHQYPMISLDNTYSVDEVRDFEQRMKNVLKEKAPKEFSYYVQPKYDGLGLAVVYEYGTFTQAITRGSGVEGEDVTLTALEIQNLPKYIAPLQDTPRMEIRGEVMMSRTEFNRINRERLDAGEKLFANPRNCASGSLRQLDPLVTRSRKLQFFAYSIPQIETSPQPSPKGEGLPVLYVFPEGELASVGGGYTYSFLVNLLSSWGFEREDFPFTLVYGIGELTQLIQRETDARREYFDFDIDGMVLKLDDMTLWDDLGRTEHHPRYSIAYKFPAKQVRTRVLSVEHSVGRTGTVTPVANLEAVEVTGVTVRRATLHNYDELEKKGVREGDYVYIMRAGEVIPEVVSVLTELRTGEEKVIDIPTHCPVCSTHLLQDAGKVAIYCPNPHCPAKIQGQLEMFVGKQGLNIDGFGVKQIELFLDLGYITDCVSVFHLGRYREEILRLEGYKEKSVNNLLDAIEISRKTTLDRVLVGLGIPQVGKKTAKVLSEYVFSLQENPEESISHILSQITYESLENLRDIGPETARSVVEYIEENIILIERLLHELTIQIPEVKTGGKLLGSSFCVTGTFSAHSRDEIHDMIEKNGGEVRSSVSAKLTYLIAGDSAGSKLEKARECGVQIITLDEFLNIIA